ncbi:tyrosine-type recombinase/integrase [Brotaphodocola sp.]|uniref:tyrosine-type recombinase/integrase n=1 Tax=Brotaphodocola sp. TaxID=3073577 RepID=UPI003D7F14B9
MALMKCPECDLQVSDKAITCPHCGYPLDKPAVARSTRKSKKRMRLPNGFGSITQFKGKNLRNPFWARVCVGRNDLGKFILKPLKPQSFFATYNEAYAALVEYNRNPYDLNDDLTVQQLYDRWTKEYFKNTSEAYQRTIASAWAFCSSVYNMRAKDLRARHIKGCMDDGYRIETKGKKKGEKIYATAGMKSRMKSMFNLMLDYALEYELVDKNYARTFDVSEDIVKEKEEAKRSHIIFTEDEMKILWDSVDEVQFVDWILMQCYMGWRPQELATLRLDEINLNEWYMQAGMKTEAGKQRIVPIHTKVRDLLKKNYDFAVSIGSEYLLNDKGQTHAGSWKITYDKYAKRFKKVIAQLGLNPEHRAHDPRMTFITRCKKAGVDEYALKEMVGHSIQDITESTYTVRDLEWLRSDLEKMQ